MPRNADELGVHAYLLLWKTQKALEAHARRSIEALGLCLSDFAVLEALLHKGPLPVSELGRKVLLTSGSMTAAVDRLEGRKLVERRGEERDRRTRIVHLTAGGRILIDSLFEQHRLDMSMATSALDTGELEQIIDLLRKLGRGAEQRLCSNPETARLDTREEIT